MGAAGESVILLLCGPVLASLVCLCGALETPLPPVRPIYDSLEDLLFMFVGRLADGEFVAVLVFLL